MFRCTITDTTSLQLAQKESQDAGPYEELRVNEPTQSLTRANAALRKEVKLRRELERKLLSVCESERRRFGQDLHDDVCQGLAGLALNARVLAQKIEKASDSAAPQAQELAEKLVALLDTTRRLSRSLHPVALNSGLTAALHDLKSAVSHRLPCELIIEGALNVPDSLALALYRIAQEATTNALQHAKASSIRVHLRDFPRMVILSVYDDGIGIPKNLPTEGGGMGLDIMKYRANSVGGHLIAEPLPQGGSRVTCVIPK
jgi:signal transduction histidine kinase